MKELAGNDSFNKAKNSLQIITGFLTAKLIFIFFMCIY